MRAALRTIAIALLGLPGFGFFSCGPPAEPPSSDDCSVAAPGSITELDVRYLETGVRVLDSEVIETVSGPQGGDMIGLEITYATAAPIGCFQHSTRVVASDGTEITAYSSALNAYPDGEGRERTGQLWVIPPDASFGVHRGQEATLAIDAYGQHFEHTGWLGYMPDPGI